MKKIQTNVRRVSSCDGKKRFSGFNLAAKTAHRQAQNTKKKFSAYPCSLCGGFHVGEHLGGARGRPIADTRQRYIVFARDDDGSEHVVGWSNAKDGGEVARIIRSEPAWTVSRVVERQRRNRRADSREARRS